jgi:hypothetical protein
MRPPRAAGRAILLAGLLAWAAPVSAQDLNATLQFPARASVLPGKVRVGEPVLYRGTVLVPPGVRVQWLLPDTGGVFTWGPLTAARSADTRVRLNPARAHDTLRVAAQLQIFSLGLVSVPGLAFRSIGPSGGVHRLPVVRVLVMPTVAKPDSADLRPVRALDAPWWERIPWRFVLLGLVLVAAVVMAVRAWRRRRATVPAAPPQVLDPAARALAELAALRARHLPEHTQFAEHAYHLTRIVRRFLEAIESMPRPGDTTPELVEHLAAGRLGREDVDRLAGLLQAWDRVKFARAGSSVEEAQRSEQGVEAFIRRRSAPAEQKVA